MEGKVLDSFGIKPELLEVFTAAFSKELAREASRLSQAKDGLSAAKQLLSSQELSDSESGIRLFVNLKNAPADEGMQTLSGWIEKQMTELGSPTMYDGEGKLIGLDGFDKLMAVKFADWGGLDRISVEDFAEGPGMVLLPEYIRRQVVRGQKMHGVVDQLVATKVQERRNTYEPLWISYPSVRARNIEQIDQGTDLPRIEIRRRTKSVAKKDYGIVLNVAYNVLRDINMPEFQVLLWFVGFNNEQDKTEEIYTVVRSGDGTSIAPTAVTNATSGTLVYEDLTKLFIEFHPFRMNALITSKVVQRNIINMAEFKDPEAGFDFQRTGNLMSPLGAKMFRNDGGTTAVNNRYIPALDTRFAVVEVRNGELLIEGDKIISQKTEEVAISETLCYAILLEDATQVLDCQSALT